LPVWTALQRCGRLPTNANPHGGMLYFREWWRLNHPPTAKRLLDRRLSTIGDVLGGSGDCIGWIACGHLYPSKTQKILARLWAWAVPHHEFDWPVVMRCISMKACRHTYNDDAAISRALGREFRFRRAMLQAKPEAVKACLEAVARVRLLRSGGAARKTTAEEP
jgi:hypothetical protein